MTDPEAPTGADPEPPSGPAPSDPAPSDPAPVDPHAVITVHRRPHRRSRLAWVGGGTVVVGLLVAGAAVVLDPHAPASQVAAATSRVGTPVLSARRAPQWTTEPVARRRLVEAIEPVVATAPATTCVGIGDGTSAWYAHETAASLAPASNMKLLTAAAALDILGADATLTTSFRTAAPVAAGGVVAGDLYMVGGGDPLLTTEGYQSRRKDDGRLPETDLEAVADQLVAAGIRKVGGSVVGDGTRYDAVQDGPGYPDRFQTDGTVAPLSALLVNDGWQVDPLTGGGTGTPADDPAAHAASVMTQLLQARGVEVVGPPRSGPATAASTPILDVPSMPVTGLVDETLTFSDNSSAELLMKEMGLASAGTGSTAAGAQAVTDWAGAQGLPTAGLVVADGSGLADANRVTCDLLAAVLRRAGPTGPVADGLAVPGQPGTLQDRFPGEEWAQRLRAKTGTLNDVTSLSGWLSTRPGAMLDFQIVENTGDRRVTADDLAFQSRLLTALLDQPTAPPVAEAGPAPPVAA